VEGILISKWNIKICASLRVCYEFFSHSAIRFSNVLSEVDDKWRGACVELAWFEALEQRGRLPEWDYSK
jgi:hypothetical protein